MALFTPANAAAMAAKSHEMRKQRDALRIAEAQAAEQLPDYVQKRLARVRAQLDKIDEMISKATDPQALDRLASAQARLSTQEFALAGRPGPGTLKPTPARRARSQSSYGPIEGPSEPAQPPTDAPNSTP